MDMFAPRERENLDYWFWKFHVGDLAFLVDLIIRRRTGLAEVRVSQWLGGVPRVVHDVTSEWATERAQVRIGSTVLTPGRCIGRAEDIEWDLSWIAGRSASALPAFVSRLQPFDTTLVAWPDARFSGSVRAGAERFAFQDLPGTFYHYWGRRLADRWIWLSATQFEGQPERRIEGLLGARTQLFGRLPFPLPVSWLWTTDGRSTEQVISGVNGLVDVRASDAGVDIVSRRLGGPRHRLAARWGAISPNDIGEGIIQTMHADLRFDESRAIPGTVGLEVRGYPYPGRRMERR